MEATGQTRVPCQECGVEILVEGRHDASARSDEPQGTVAGRACVSCGVAYCLLHTKLRWTVRKKCPVCKERKALVEVLLQEQRPEPEESLPAEEVSCARCGRAVRNEGFLSPDEWGSRYLKVADRDAGRRCQVCGAVYCFREAEHFIGVRADLWDSVVCPTCGVRGGLTLRVLEASHAAADRILDELGEERWAEDEAVRADLLARLEDHGDLVLDMALHDDAVADSWAPGVPLDVARLAELGATALVDDAAVAELIATAEDPERAYMVRDDAYRALARLAAATGNEAAIQAVLRGLAEAEDARTRGIIAYYVGRIGGDQAREALQRATGDDAAFPRDQVPELQPGFGDWFVRTMLNPFQIGVKQTYRVGEIAKTALRALDEQPNTVDEN